MSIPFSCNIGCLRLSGILTRIHILGGTQNKGIHCAKIGLFSKLDAYRQYDDSLEATCESRDGRFEDENPSSPN